MKYLFSWLRYPIDLKLWVLFLILFPFYFFGSGLPQVADWVMGILIIKNLSNGFFPQASYFKYLLRPLGFLFIYAFAVNACWFPFVDAPPSRPYLQFLFPLFFLYNTLSVSTALKLYQKFGYELLLASLTGIVLSVLFQVSLTPISMTRGFRDSLFFNNPNQLGYFVLIAMSFYLFLDGKLQPPMWMKAMFFVSAAFLSAISASKSAMLSGVILLFVNFLDSGILRFKQLIGGLLAIALVTWLALNTQYGSELMEQVTGRFNTIGTDSDDSLEGRGYDRMWRYPGYMIFGAGEGGFERFYDDLKFEMHSTFGTLLFSYGIPGFISFWFFIYRIYRGQRLVHFLYALPVFAYGVTHMGLRFTLFWLFFAVVIATMDWERIQKWRMQHNLLRNQVPP